MSNLISVAEYTDALFKHYRIVSVLSERNESKVLRLRHKNLNRDLILRSLNTKVAAYDALCNVKSENLPEIYDTKILTDGQIVLEEFISGITVADVMKSGKYRYRGAKQVLGAVCDALTVLHQNGIVHRDVKPENIIISDEGRVILTDFNISRRISTNTKDTVVMGTVGYASPEQLGVTATDTRTDIYAMGVLLNVMLTGKHPSEMLARGKAGKIVKKCTAINPEDRYQSAQKLAEAL